jgi:F-type H+/Na+-transporting ATPase subunit alpha
VGGSAQTRAMRSVAGRMKLELAQFRSLAAFAQFASDLDPVTRNQLERGLRLQEILKQTQYSPVPLSEQVAIIWAATNGHLDDVPVDAVPRFELEFRRFMLASYPELMQTIEQEKAISDDTTAALKTAIETFKKTVSF